MYEEHVDLWTHKAHPTGWLRPSTTLRIKLDVICRWLLLTSAPLMSTTTTGCDETVRKPRRRSWCRIDAPPHQSASTRSTKNTTVTCMKHGHGSMAAQELGCINESSNLQVKQRRTWVAYSILWDEWVGDAAHEVEWMHHGQGELWSMTIWLKPSETFKWDCLGGWYFAPGRRQSPALLLHQPKQSPSQLIRPSQIQEQEEMGDQPSWHITALGTIWKWSTKASWRTQSPLIQKLSNQRQNNPSHRRVHHQIRQVTVS